MASSCRGRSGAFQAFCRHLGRQLTQTSQNQEEDKPAARAPAQRPAISCSVTVTMPLSPGRHFYRFAGGQ